MLKVFLTFLLSGYFYLAYSQTEQKDIVIGKSFKFDSKVLHRSVDLFVTKPEGDQEEPYPIAILLGSEKHDFRAAILKDKFISIGVQSSDIKKEFLKEEDRHIYLKFILNELLPYFEKEFHVSKVRLITGHSLAGATVIDCFLKNPDSFSIYIATSPLLQLIKTHQLDSVQIVTPRALYFSIGRNENFPQLEQANHDFHFLLDSVHIKNLKWKFDVLKDESHTTNAFTGFSKGYSFYQSFSSIPDSVLSANLDTIKLYIDKVKDQLDISIVLDENVIMPHLLLNLSNNSYETVAETMKYIAQNNPNLVSNELDVMLEIAKQLRIKGGREMAYYTYQYIYEITGNEVAEKNMQELKQGY
nr:alpha/beta hydrolase-fold protein [uncultured Carboxylicivirga sp.]